MANHFTNFFVILGLVKRATEFVDSVDPDGPARNEPSHQNLHCSQLFAMFKKKKHLRWNGLA